MATKEKVVLPGHTDQKAYAGVRPEVWWTKGLEIYNPDDLVEKKGLRVYRGMLNRNPAVKVGIGFLESARLAKGWEIRAGKAMRRSHEEVEEMADYGAAAIDNVEGGFDRAVLLPVFEARYMGFMVLEKICSTFKTGPHAGRWYLSSANDLWQENVTFKLGERGQIVGFTNTTAAEVQRFPEEELPYFIIHTHRKQKGNHYGTSELRDLYFAHASMDRLARYYNVALEKHAGGVMIATVPPGTTAAAKKEKRDALVKAHGSLVWVKEEGEELEFVAPGTGVGSSFLEAMLYYGNQILVGLGIPQTTFSGTGAEGEGGSMALATVQTETLDLNLHQIGAESEAVVNERVLWPLVRSAYGADIDPVELPRFAWLPHREKDSDVRARLVETVKRIGLPFGINWAYEFLGIQPPDEDEVTIGRPAEGDETVIGDSSATPIVQYHIDAGVVKVNDILRQLGIPSLPDGDQLIRDWQKAHGIQMPGEGGLFGGLFGGGGRPVAGDRPIDADGGASAGNGATRFAELRRPFRSLTVNDVLDKIGLVRMAEGDKTVGEWQEELGIGPGGATRGAAEFYRELHATEEKVDFAEVTDTLDAAEKLAAGKLEDAAIGAREGLRELLKRRAPRLRKPRRMDGGSGGGRRRGR